MPVGKRQPSITEQFMVTGEKPVTSHGSVSGGVWKSVEDFFADNGRQTRIDDAPGLAFVESLDHVGSDGRVGRVWPLRPPDPEVNAIAQRGQALVRSPARFLQRHLSYAAQKAWHHAGLSGVDPTVFSGAR